MAEADVATFHVSMYVREICIRVKYGAMRLTLRSEADIFSGCGRELDEDCESLGSTSDNGSFCFDWNKMDLRVYIETCVDTAYTMKMHIPLNKESKKSLLSQLNKCLKEKNGETADEEPTK